MSKSCESLINKLWKTCNDESVSDEIYLEKFEKINLYMKKNNKCCNFQALNLFDLYKDGKLHRKSFGKILFEVKQYKELKKENKRLNMEYDKLNSEYTNIQLVHNKFKKKYYNYVDDTENSKYKMSRDLRIKNYLLAGSAFIIIPFIIAKFTKYVYLYRYVITC